MRECNWPLWSQGDQETDNAVPATDSTRLPRSIRLWLGSTSRYPGQDCPANTHLLRLPFVPLMRGIKNSLSRSSLVPCLSDVISVTVCMTLGSAPPSALRPPSGLRPLLSAPRAAHAPHPPRLRQHPQPTPSPTLCSTDHRAPRSCPPSISSSSRCRPMRRPCIADTSTGTVQVRDQAGLLTPGRLLPVLHAARVSARG